MGDAILGFVIANTIFKKFPEATEGELTRLRAFLVKGEKLAEIARNINLSEQLILGPGELKSGGWRRNSILANTLEAIIGAVYLDSGFDCCQRVILNLYQPYLKEINLTDIKKDPKSLLQEFLQSRKQDIPVYEVVHEKGTSHNPEFKVSCSIAMLGDIVYAEGKSKRKAEQAAAKKALELLKSNI